jgi:hypothetical protein
MSLIQHVTQQEGHDREEALVDLFLPPIDRQISREHAAERRLSLESAVSGTGFLGVPGKTVRRVISYDAIKKPEEPVAGEEYGGLTPYKVSTTKRVGKFFLIRQYHNARQLTSGKQYRLLQQYSHVGSQAELSLDLLR